MTSHIIITFLRYILGLLAGISYNAILARYLGAEGFGQYSLVIAYASTATALLMFGLPSANTYLLGRKDHTVTTAYYGSMLLGTSSTLLTIVIWLLIVRQGFVDIGSGKYSVLKIMLLCITILTIFEAILKNIYLGMKRYLAFNLLNLNSKILFSVGIVCLAILGNLTVDASLITYTVSHAIIVAYMILELQIKAKVVSNRNELIQYIKESAAYGVKQYLNDVMAAFYNRLPLYLVAIMASIYYTGIYSAALALFNVLGLMSMAISQVYFPELSRRHKENKINNSKNDGYAYLIRVIFLLSAVFVFIAGFASPLIFNLIYGEKFIESAYLFIILLVGFPFASVNRLLAYDISARGAPQYNFYGSMIILGVITCASILFYKEYGVYGIATAFTMGHVVNSLYKITIMVKRFGQDIWPYFVVTRADINVATRYFSRQVLKRKMK